jgi:hypothetical protein
MHSDRKCRKGRARDCAAALAIVVLAMGVWASSALALPGNFWGVVPQANPSAEQLQRLKAGGVDSVRVPIVWGVLQPSRFVAPDWSAVDPVIQVAAESRLNVLPFLYGAPSWAVPVDRSVSSRPPRFLPVRSRVQRAGWKAFLRSAAQRYGPNGSFWAENPGVPRRPIRFWQIWNEPNFFYFVGRPNPAEYGKLVKLSYAALKSVDRGARLVLGGLFSRPKQALSKRRPPRAYFATDFLAQMYRRTPGIKSKFHGVALHPYTGTFKRLTPYIEGVRTVLKAYRDAGKGLWLTELGWSSQRPRRGNSFAKGRRGQVKQLKGAFRLLRKMQRRWRIARVYWFSVNDQPGSCNFCGGTGLFGDGFVPKPAWYAYVRFAGGRP